MEIVKKLLHQLGSWEYTALCLLVLITLIMHFSIIMQPSELIFDEQHYVTDARHILQGEGTERIEHPPLGKLFIVFGMFLFGDNPFGWRFFSIFFGAICIILCLIVLDKRYEDRVFLENRIEMWCLKAIENWKIKME